MNIGCGSAPMYVCRCLVAVISRGSDSRLAGHGYGGRRSAWHVPQPVAHPPYSQIPPRCHGRGSAGGGAWVSLGAWPERPVGGLSSGRGRQLWHQESMTGMSGVTARRSPQGLSVRQRETESRWSTAIDESRSRPIAVVGRVEWPVRQGRQELRDGALGALTGRRTTARKSCWHSQLSRSGPVIDDDTSTLRIPSPLPFPRPGR